MTEANEQMWADLVARLRSRCTLGDPAQKWAFEQWERETTSVRSTYANFEVVAELDAAVFDYVEQLFAAEVEERAAIFKARVAKDHSWHALVQLAWKVAEMQGVFVNEQGSEALNPALLAVVRPDPKAVRQSLATVVGLALADAEIDSAGQLAMRSDLQVLAKDLTEFVSESPSNREAVLRVCEDVTFAREKAEEPDAPDCLQFLARLVAAAGALRPPRANREIGFALNRREKEMAGGRHG